MPDSLLLEVLADALTCGEQTVAATFARAVETLGRPWRWLRPLVRRYVAAFPAGESIRPRRQQVVRFLREDAGFKEACLQYGSRIAIRRWLTAENRMQPVAAARHWPVREIGAVGELAAWLNLTPGELEWFADLKALTVKGNLDCRLKHYRYRVLVKGSGGIRLIEAPKARLKEIQRQILAEILDPIPTHDAVHGFRKQRSIKTYVQPHTGRRVVLRLDLRDFFPAISGARIQGLFRTIGYPEEVADLLGGICTNVTPRDVWGRCPADFDRGEIREAVALYGRPHLPQGAPTSPALANLCAYRADCRLSGLAQSAGAVYTRYADDLAFSGDHDFDRRVHRFALHAAAILQEEGFAVHHRKTRIMRQGVRQHVAGLVANRSVNVIRADFDRLKAILTNCLRLGPETQNRGNHANFRAHLDGRISFVEMVHPARGVRLREIFERVHWER